MTRNRLPMKLYLAAASFAALGLAAMPVQAVQDTAASKAKAEQSQARPSALVFNQKLDGKAVNLAYVYMPEAGFITVYKGKDGVASGKSIGAAALPAGDHRDVKVELSTSITSGTELFVSLAKGGGDAFDESKHTSVWAMDAIPTESRFEAL